MPSSSESAISRCWAPSWRLRSSRLRSRWPASITRPREPSSSCSFAFSSACSRPFSSAIAAAALTARAARARRRAPGRGRAPPGVVPSLSIKVTDRASSGPGRRTGRPSWSAQRVVLRQPVGEARAVGSRSARDERLGQVGGRRLGAQLDQQVADRGASQAGVEHREQEDERRETDDDEHRALDRQKRIERDREGLAINSTARQHERERERVDEHLDRGPERAAGGGAAAEHDAEPDEQQTGEDDELDLEEVCGQLRSVDHRDRVAGVEAAEHQADDVEPSATA